MGLMSKVLPQPARADRLRAIRRASEEASRLGITSIHEAGTSDASLELFEEVRREGALNVRVYAALSVTDAMTAADADAFDALRLKYAANPQIRVGAIKVMADGVIEAHTAAMLAPYTNNPATGHANYTPQELQRIVSMMDRRGWQVMTHAIGDGAVRMTLDAYEAAAQANPALPAGRRHRIEHAETIDPADIPRFARQNTIVSYMPFHANPTPAQLTVWTTNIGPERSSRGWIVPHDAAGRRPPGVRERLARGRARSAPRDQHGRDAPHSRRAASGRLAAGSGHQPRERHREHDRRGRVCVV